MAGSVTIVPDGPKGQVSFMLRIKKCSFYALVFVNV